VAVVALLGTSASAEPLRLEDAIQLALTRNERAAIANLDVVVADAGVTKARVAFLPVLQATGSGAYRPRDKPIDTAQGALTLNQPLFAPSAFPLDDQAKHALEGQRAQSTDDRRQLAFDAAKAFFNVLLADQVVKAAQKKLDTAKADLADTDAQVKAQLVSSNDVTRAQIGVGSSERELAADQGSLTTANVQLEFMLNAPVAGGLAAPTTLLAEGARHPRRDLDLLECVDRAGRVDRVLDRAGLERRHVDGVLELRAALAADRRIGRLRASGKHRERGERDRLDHRSPPIGSRPIAWRSPRYAVATLNCASA